ncbi:MAG: hypothetical protein JOS17DRAFT_808760 [Linnemannia elongata]|nr:MAG: hypothetical protein JOS17DRAFT_808760 [Linnemannia elongata]
MDPTEGDWQQSGGQGEFEGVQAKTHSDYRSSHKDPTREGGKTKGFASPVKAELMGLIAGIIATPQDQDVCIRLDNQEAVKLFNDIVINRRRASVRAKLRCDYAVEWAIVARICSERTGSTTVEWVKGHSSDRWNAEADKAAKEAHSAVGKAWEASPEDADN